MTRWRYVNPTPDHARRFRDWQPKIVDGEIVNGCMPLDDFTGRMEDDLAASAVPFDVATAYTMDDMPVVRYDDPEFQAWLDRRIEVCDALRNDRIQNLNPWDVLKSLPAKRKNSDRLYFSQGGRPSCAMHGDHFAFCDSTLSGIALGLPLIYESFNPIYTFYIGKGGSYRGGMNLVPCADASNKIGHFPESVAGTDNQNVRKGYSEYMPIAEKHQAGIVLLPTDDAETIAHAATRCCRGALGVNIGNATAVSGATTDKNGIKVVVIRGGWDHATSLKSYRAVSGTEYVFWANSHGDRYGRSDEGEPASGAWMPYSSLVTFCKTAKRYGTPYAILPEALTVPDGSHVPSIKVPFPGGWRS